MKHGWFQHSTPLAPRCSSHHCTLLLGKGKDRGRVREGTAGIGQSLPTKLTASTPLPPTPLTPTTTKTSTDHQPTTRTTSAAFFANLVSPISAIKGFGLYCGLVVATDYVMVMVFLPAVVLYYDVYYAKCCVPCFGRARGTRTHEQLIAGKRER